MEQDTRIINLTFHSLIYQYFLDILYFFRLSLGVHPYQNVDKMTTVALSKKRRERDTSLNRMDEKKHDNSILMLVANPFTKLSDLLTTNETISPPAVCRRTALQTNTLYPPNSPLLWIKDLSISNEIALTILPTIDICIAGGMRTLDKKGEIKLYCISVIEDKALGMGDSLLEKINEKEKEPLSW